MDDDPAYDIAVARVSGDAQDCEAPLREAIECTLHRHGATAARIGVAVVDDAQIAHLNSQHLDHEGPTDVIAFDLRDEPTMDASDDSQDRNRASEPPTHSIEGEIVVSIDTARRESQARGHPVEAELALYAVHGVLHLLGYDDQQEQEAVRMHEVEDQILSEVGWGPVFRAKRR